MDFKITVLQLIIISCLTYRSILKRRELFEDLHSPDVLEHTLMNGSTRRISEFTVFLYLSYFDTKI